MEEILDFERESESDKADYLATLKHTGKNYFQATGDLNNPVIKTTIDFERFARIPPKGKVHSLHKKIREANLTPIEISTAASNTQFKQLSSLSPIEIKLQLNKLSHHRHRKDNQAYIIECLYQGSKHLIYSKPHYECYRMHPMDAKDFIEKLPNKRIIAFNLMSDSDEWNTSDVPYFFHYIYIHALIQHKFHEVCNYEKSISKICFTNNYSSSESIRNQAYSMALYMTLKKNKALDILNDKQTYIAYMKSTTKQ